MRCCSGGGRGAGAGGGGSGGADGGHGEGRGGWGGEAELLDFNGGGGGLTRRGHHGFDDESGLGVLPDFDHAVGAGGFEDVGDDAVDGDGAGALDGLFRVGDHHG